MLKLYGYELTHTCYLSVKTDHYYYYASYCITCYAFNASAHKLVFEKLCSLF